MNLATRLEVVICGRKMGEKREKAIGGQQNESWKASQRDSVRETETESERD